MVLTQYFYKYSTEQHKDRVSIPELNRAGYMTPQYMSMFKEELNSIKLEGTVGFIYSAGASIHQAELRFCNKPDYTNTLSGVHDGPMVIKSLVAYMTHKYVSMFVKNGNTVIDTEIVSNTCASSMYAVGLAKKWLERMDHVIVLTEDKTSFDTIRIFDEHRIDVKASDGFACAVFSKEGSGVKITDCKRGFQYSTNPFYTGVEGYSMVDTKSVDAVKVHGTGTAINDVAEEAVYGDRPMIKYKDKIGHSQGSSGLLEMLMAIDDYPEYNTMLCVASGLGGYYASCKVTR